MNDRAPASPIHDRARQLASPGLRVVLALLVLRTFLRLGFLGAAAVFVGRLVMDGGDAAWPAGVALALLILSTVAGLLVDRFQASFETQLTLAMRDEVVARLDAMPTRALQALPVGRLVVSMQRHPEALATLVIGHRAATLMMAVGPLMAAGAILLVSWQAALLVLALTPLMIIFFVLVGDTIRRRADAQEQAFGRLAGQFSDRIRTLPTILANHALASEEAKLAGRLRAYAANTMSVLRVAFLNAATIDFFGSLSIAMLAVFLGLGHLGLASIPGFSGLQLWQSLFILMIAPDYFAPFRRFAEQYHAKAEGQAAAASLDSLLAQEATEVPVAKGFPDGLPDRGLVAIVGPSGSGKTTLLRDLAGVDGRARQLNDLTWVATDSFIPAGNLESAISWPAEPTNSQELERVAAGVGLIDGHLPGGLGASIEADGANLSGGQRLRLSVARGLASGKIIVADEPTAKLDAANAERVRALLRRAANERLVLVATHDPLLADLADQRLDLAVGEAA